MALFDISHLENIRERTVRAPSSKWEWWRSVEMFSDVVMVHASNGPLLALIQGIIMAHLGEWEQARDFFREALPLEGALNKWAHLGLARALFESGDESGFYQIPALTQVLGGSVDYWQMRAHTFINRGHWQSAYVAFEKARELGLDTSLSAKYLNDLKPYAPGNTN